MALLASAMRAGAFTQSSAPIDEWFAGRQTGWWFRQHRRAGRDPVATPGRDPAATLEALHQLRERGVIDQAEFDGLAKRLGV